MRHQNSSTFGPIVDVAPGEASATIAAETPQYTVAVRTLCEFTAKRGDLDLRFTPSPSAQEGIKGHAQVASIKIAGNKAYQREVALSGAFQHLKVRGRADGFDPVRKRVEEVKTHRGDLTRLPSNHRELHWAQAKVYGWLLCEREALERIDVALVYFDMNSQKETVFCEPYAAQTLREFFEALCGRFIAWADQELAHKISRNAFVSHLQFPHQSFRSGQRLLAEAVFKASTQGRSLMAQAPTGIGKTVGTLYPALKAIARQSLQDGAVDKLFFLTAKTPGRQLALDAMERLQGTPHNTGAPNRPIRVLELVARDKACEHPDKDCHGDSCPLAKGFYDRLPAARDQAATTGLLDKPGLRAVALHHNICPYYLGQDMARWSDVIVGDYNHYFDLNAMLYGLTLNEGWRVGILLDEAHNLIDRARQPMLEQAAKSLRQNAYWMAYVDEAQSEPARLDRTRTRDKIIRSITAADLQKLAQAEETQAQSERDNATALSGKGGGC